MRTRAGYDENGWEREDARFPILGTLQSDRQISDAMRDLISLASDFLAADLCHLNILL